VRDFRRHAGLDLLPQLLFRDGELDLAVFRSILDARLRIGPKVAELAAERRGPELAESLEEALRTLQAEIDPLEWQGLPLTFWDHVVDGAGSIVFRLMYNAFRAAYEPALAALPTAVSADGKWPDSYRKLADAIRAGDSAGAKKAARDLLERANATVMAELDRRGKRR
jgi:DNA-binding FadR family transcriptional regulator